MAVPSISNAKHTVTWTAESAFLPRCKDISVHKKNTKCNMPGLNTHTPTHAGENYSLSAVHFRWSAKFNGGAFVPYAETTEF